MPDEPTTQSERSGPTPPERCAAMAAQGDLLALLDFLETEASPALLHSSLGMIGRCIRTRARKDLSALSEDLLTRIIGMAGLLLIKVQLYVATRLQEAEQAGAHALSQLPRDITEEGWLDRLERLSRFVGEMAATAARVRHLNGLCDDADRSKRSRRRSRSSATLADDRGQAAARQGPSDNGGVRRPGPTAVRFDRLASPLP